MKFFLRRFLFISLFFPVISQAIENPKQEIEGKKVGFFTILGNRVDLNSKLTEASGQEVTLRETLSSELPTIILPIYYGCPRLCGLTLGGFLELVKKIDLSLGKEFQVATVSFDPEEKAEIALEKSNDVYKQVERADFDPKRWRFFVGEQSVLARLMDSIGFRYQKDGEEFAHASGFIILTPDGEISQYFTGIEFSPWDVRLALVEASKGKIGSTIDHILLYCFRFDPTKGKYTWVAFNTVRIGVFISVLACVTVVLLYSRSRRSVG